MEGRKPAASGASSSSSSLSADLFGAKDSMHAANSSSAGIFSTMFSSSSTGLVGDSSRTDVWRKQSHDQVWNGKHMSKDGIPQSNEHRSVPSKDGSSVFLNESVEPCFLSSSLYYGGRDICSHPPNTQASGTSSTYKKDGGEDDSSNSNSASRGNWWQGSLYY
ncbi:hypothetical protein MRB53_032849 [Persea americana]|uniref:Uncharacterized protein n=1 Tax=Persea americana TaxID=3435 RepID=A0ACC2KT18_PERAE|nr:hypothetical protein MRB53_032849 [Persea americana]